MENLFKEKIVSIYPEGSKKDILYKLDKVENKIESERRFFAESMRPLKEEQLRLVRQLKKYSK
tara:strand:+ start:91 stop:279 length:189 start_codon:yes stop_codon:yes gene_type:complete